MEERDSLTSSVIGCAIEVHRTLGPGLLESTYEQCLAYELSANRISISLQVPVPVTYKEINLDCGYRLDIVVEKKLILELKSVATLSALHEAQLLTYMKLSGINIGLLLNFNVKRMKDGIKRFKY